MGRSSRRRQNLRPRSKKWTGLHLAVNVQQAPLTDFEVLRIVEVVSDVETKTDYTLDGIYLRFATRRLAVTPLQSVAFMVAIQDTDSIGLVQPLNPVSPNLVDIQNADVLAWSPLGVPGFNTRFDSTGAFVGSTVNGEVVTEFFHIKSARKLHRGKHAITLSIASEAVDDAVQTKVLARAMLLG